MKRIYFLAAMLMVALGLQAQRVKPIPVGTTELITSESTDGQLYYLYSKTGQFFYTSGNNWGTQATQGAEGHQIYFRQFMDTDETEWDGQRYVIRNMVSTSKGWDDVFLSDIYLINDCSGRGNNVWAAEWKGDEVRFYAAKFSTSTFDENSYGQRVYMGYVPDDGGTKLQPTGVIPDAVPVNWTLVKSADYDDWLAEKHLYVLAEDLKASIDEAKSIYPDIDLSQLEAIYNDATSTEEALKGAKEEIKTAIKSYLGTKHSPDEPIDASLLIVNPDYAQSNNGTGWSGTAMTISDGCAELFSLEQFDTYQDITGLPNGIYKLNLHGLYRVADCDNQNYYTTDGRNLQPDARKAYLYGKSGDVTSDVLMMDILEGLSETKKHDLDHEFAPGLWGPNRRAGFTLYNAEGLYSANTVYAPVTDGTLRMGLVANGIEPVATWCVFNNWSLAYCGNDFEAYDVWRTDFTNHLFVEDGTIAQTSLLTPFQTASDAVGVATTAEEIVAQYQVMHALYPQIKQSAKAYTAYMQAIAAIKESLKKAPLAESEPLLLLQDYLNEELAPNQTYAHGTYLYIIDRCALDQAELQAEQAYVDSLLSRARKLDVKEGADVTELLKNADMSKKNFQDWNPAAAISGNFDSAMGLAEFPVAQAFNTKFELSQKVTDIPDGLYKLELNGLYRPENEDNTDESPVILYINDFESPIKNINADALPEDDAVDMVNCYIGNAGSWPYDNITDNGYVPNSVTGCSYAFKAGRYKQTVYGLVTGGEMTVGLKDPREAKDARSWSVFTNFKLTYMAKNVDAMNEVLDSLKSRVNVMNSKEQYCSLQAREDAISIIEQGKAETDPDKKYEILKQANEYMKVLASSVAIYAQLQTMLDYVNDSYAEAASKAGEFLPDAPSEDPEYWTPEYKAFDDFYVYTYTLIQEGIEAGKYSNEEAEALIKQLNQEPIVDVIYVMGDLQDVSWATLTDTYPLTRQPDGTYQGTFKAIDRSSDAGYGNRSMIYFHYQGAELECTQEHPRWITPERNQTDLRTVAEAKQLAGFWGGEWKVTINAERTHATFEPVDAWVVPDYCYLAGALKGDDWKQGKNHPLVHMGKGKFYGEFEIEAGGSDDITLFAGGWSMNGNSWTEGRIGTAVEADTVTTDQYGQPIKGADEFYGQPRWILEPGRFSILFDAREMSVTFTRLENELAQDGTAAHPFRIQNLYDMVALHKRLQPGKLNHVILEQDIDMSTIKTWTALNLIDNKDGDKNYMNWVDFDGQNHVVSGFTSTDGNYSSLFGVLCGAVRNVGFPAADITCTATGSGVLGGYVGHSNFKVNGELQTTTVENVWVEGKLHVASGYCGGLFGNVGGPTAIKNCFAHIDITVDNEETITGGIVGRVGSDLTMDNVYAAGSVTGLPIVTGVIGGVNTSYQGTSTYRNVCVWNNEEQVFGAGKDDDVMEGILYYDGTNFSALQQAVVAWDPQVWSCTMEEGAYPMLKNVIGTGIGSVDAGKSSMPPTSGTIYNLNGQRVQKMHKGIYILNGKRVLVK